MFALLVIFALDVEENDDELEEALEEGKEEELVVE